MVRLTHGELLINVVIHNKPKVLTGLHQKGTWYGSEASYSSDADNKPPAERQSLTHLGTHAERGKPVTSPTGKATRKRGRRDCWYRMMEKAKAAQ
jgi:hypothetical protein